VTVGSRGGPWRPLCRNVRHAVDALGLKTGQDATAVFKAYQVFVAAKQG